MRKRIVLKLSGEALAGDNHVGINHRKVNEIAAEIKTLFDLGNIDLSELVEQIDYDAVERYYKHLETNKAEIKEFLGV